MNIKLLPAPNYPSLQKANMQMLLAYLENSIERHLDGYLFETNNTKTQDLIQYAVSNYLQTLNTVGAIGNYQVVCDGSNNTSSQINNNELNIEVYIQPLHGWLKDDSYDYDYEIFL